MTLLGQNLHPCAKSCRSGHRRKYTIADIPFVAEVITALVAFKGQTEMLSTVCTLPHTSGWANSNNQQYTMLPRYIAGSIRPLTKRYSCVWPPNP